MRVSLLFCLFFITINITNAQVRNIVIDSSTGSNMPNEPCIAIDPSNPNHMVAGANLNNVYYSADGGITWYRDTLYSTLGVYGDPVVIADTTGAFYYIHNCRNYGISNWSYWFDRITCQRTEDISSHTWTNGGYTGWAPIPKIEDKPWAVMDNKTNTIYLTWTRFDRYQSSATTDSSIILFSKSTDRGDIWSIPVRLNKNAGDCMDQDKTVEGAVPCVGTHGEVFVSWAKNDGIVFNRSVDAGTTWLDSEKYVTDVPGGWDYNIAGLNRCNGLPFTACDISNSPYKGTIYINWTDQRNGVKNTDVWICKSTDNGDSWTAPFKVNDDTGAKQQFMSSMSVDPITGYIYVLFYDRRNYVDTATYYGVLHNATDVYLAISRDGANTFQNYKINDSTFYPNAAVFFGDYTYIAAYNNVVRPIWGALWSGGSFGNQKIMTAIIDSTILGVNEPEFRTNKNSIQVYPNPIVDNATIVYELASTENVSLWIADITGRKIGVLKNNESCNVGKHFENIKFTDYCINPGIYYLIMKSADFMETTKVLIVR